MHTLIWAALRLKVSRHLSHRQISWAGGVSINIIAVCWRLPLWRLP